MSSETFTADNGKMTASNKLNRINLEREFKQAINHVYERVEKDNSNGNNS